jgi:hypothetical protein
MGAILSQLEMQPVKVKKGELLATVKENLAKHVKEYEEACKGYKEIALTRIEEITDELKQMITNLKENQVIELVGISFGLEVPRSYEKAYQQVIRMLEMSVDEIIELSAGEFSCFVMDDWDWKARFVTTTANYSNQNVMAAKRRVLAKKSPLV